jgi:hypothetical protein
MIQVGLKNVVILNIIVNVHLIHYVLEFHLLIIDQYVFVREIN